MRGRTETALHSDHKASFKDRPPRLNEPGPQGKHLFKASAECGARSAQSETPYEWVKEWRCRHPLPVVAMESILHIYRRAVFRLRATPASDVFPGQSLRFGTE